MPKVNTSQLKIMSELSLNFTIWSSMIKYLVEVFGFYSFEAGGGLLLALKHFILIE